jgi:hypothetical protein
VYGVDWRAGSTSLGVEAGLRETVIIMMLWTDGRWIRIRN